MTQQKSNRKLAVMLTLAHRGDDVRLYHKLGRSLAKKYDVSLITPVKVKLDTGSDPIPNFEVVNIACKGRFDTLLKLYHTACRMKPDVIICIEPQTILPAILVRRARQSALIYDCHEFYGESFSERFPAPLRKPARWFYRALENFLAHRVDGIIAVNEVIARRFEQFTDHMALCPNFLNKHIDSAEQEPVEKEYDLIYAGGMLIEKGILVILQAMNGLRERFPELRVLFLGKFYNQATEEQFFSAVKQLGIEKHVVYGGQVSHLEAAAAMQKTRLGVVMMNPAYNRYWDSLPLKFMEFLNAGLPVIAQNMPILQHVVEEHQVGACVDFTAESLASAVEKLLSKSDADGQAMCRRAREAARKLFMWENIEADLLKMVANTLRKRLLMFAYFYPPLGASGVQRPCKMVWYLRQQGILSDVISVKDIVFHSYDHEMVRQCGHRSLTRTKSLDPMSILKKMLPSRKGSEVYFQTAEWKKRLVRGIWPIDDKIGWLPFALSAALCRKNRPAAVMATTGPYTGGLAAYIYSKLTGIPLAIDYRDSYTDHPYLGFLTPVHRLFAQFVERCVLERAFLVSTAADDMKEKLIARYGNHLRQKTHVMYNGWDKRDFHESVEPNPDRKIVRFCYLGNFYGLQSVEFFIRALRELQQEERLPDDVEFSFTGNYFFETLNFLNDANLASKIHVHRQVEHTQAVTRMMQADALLLFVATPRGKGILTGKVFEYLRSGREILAMVPPDGEVAGILRDCNYQDICPMEDVGAIKEKFLAVYHRIKAGETPAHPNIEKYSRESQLDGWIKVLKERF